MMQITNVIYYTIPEYIFFHNWFIYTFIIIIILIYKKYRTRHWRIILKKSIEYHKFHLSSAMSDPSINANSKELAQSMLWGVTKQLPMDIKDGKGGRALINSLLAKKTSLNTCGMVFYECAQNLKSIDNVIFRLNNTLISTLYRIFILESLFSVLGLMYFDLNILFHIIFNSGSGTGRLYIDMNKKSKKIHVKDSYSG